MAGKFHWKINDIVPNRDYWLSEAATVIGINCETLRVWRRQKRLCVYENQALTRGDWLLEAIRKRPTPLTDTEMKRRHRKHWPERAKARSAVTCAIRNGSLIPQPCEICGSTKRIESHHDNYSKPLEVRWLCHEHHRWVHRKNANPKTAWGSVHRIKKIPSPKGVA